jgi:hypothetical protein
MVGYLGFAPAPGPAGAVIGVHPERVVTGARPDRGVVLHGTVTACRPAGAGWEADLAAGPATVTCRLPERVEAGAEMTVTVTDPPWFGPDGTAVEPPGPPGRPAAPPGPADSAQVGA